mmetsp:Transcript_63358/g.162998  ORF Transcript_63358/g.162998 Transcript_63358/m.162998 type:complete len:578 (-) Transcript_63358:181-1914(-)
MRGRGAGGGPPACLAIGHHAETLFPLLSLGSWLLLSMLDLLDVWSVGGEPSEGRSLSAAIALLVFVMGCAAFLAMQLAVRWEGDQTRDMSVNILILPPAVPGEPAKPAWSPPRGLAPEPWLRTQWFWARAGQLILTGGAVAWLLLHTVLEHTAQAVFGAATLYTLLSLVCVHLMLGKTYTVLEPQRPTEEEAAPCPQIQVLEMASEGCNASNRGASYPVCPVSRGPSPVASMQSMAINTRRWRPLFKDPTFNGKLLLPHLNGGHLASSAPTTMELSKSNSFSPDFEGRASSPECLRRCSKDSNASQVRKGSASGVERAGNAPSVWQQDRGSATPQRQASPLDGPLRLPAFGTLCSAGTKHSHAAVLAGSEKRSTTLQSRDSSALSDISSARAEPRPGSGQDDVREAPVSAAASSQFTVAASLNVPAVPQEPGIPEPKNFRRGTSGNSALTDVTSESDNAYELDNFPLMGAEYSRMSRMHSDQQVIARTSSATEHVEPMVEKRFSVTFKLDPPSESSTPQQAEDSQSGSPPVSETVSRNLMSDSDEEMPAQEGASPPCGALAGDTDSSSGGALSDVSG